MPRGFNKATRKLPTDMDVTAWRLVTLSSNMFLNITVAIHFVA